MALFLLLEQNKPRCLGRSKVLPDTPFEFSKKPKIGFVHDSPRVPGGVRSFFSTSSAAGFHCVWRAQCPKGPAML